MAEQRFLITNLLTLLIGLTSTEHCDRATTARVQEGNIGQTGDFNWLGVLSVHLHDEGKIRMALTGIILIKRTHALANADDIVRIPQHAFQTDSRAMFLVSRDTPWFVKPSSYVTHPEYESYTYNSIALIVFNLDEVNDFPLNPICLPSGSVYNTSKYLYLTGFTDENQVMEKIIYKIQYLEKAVCEEFYDRAGLSSQKRIPSAYFCGYAPSNVTQCVWDNGMALVSNATGYFHLIGFGVYGPGCAAPARFIDLFQYFYWINSITNPDEIYDDSSLYRRKDDDEVIPVHELFTTNGSQTETGKIIDDPEHAIERYQFEPYPFKNDPLKYHIIRPDEDKRSLLIFSLNNTWEQFANACYSPKALVYNEFFTLMSNEREKGSLTYKLSLYDMHNTVASCVRVIVDSASHSDAIISFKEVLNYKEGASNERPDEILQEWDGVNIKPEPQQAGSWSPHTANLKPTFIRDDDVMYRRVLNCDLYIKLEFTKKATLQFQIYSEPGALKSNHSWWNSSTTESTNLTTATESTNVTTATESTNLTTATESTNLTTATESTNVTTATESTNLTTATESTNLTTATESTNLTTATESTNLTTATESTNLTTATESTNLTTATESTNLTTATESTNLTTATESTNLTTATESTNLTTATESTNLTTATESTNLIPTPESRKKLKLSLQETSPYSLRGQDVWTDNIIKKGDVKLITEEEEVTESAASSESPAAVVSACWLVSAFLRRVLFKS